MREHAPRAPHGLHTFIESHVLEGREEDHEVEMLIRERPVHLSGIGTVEVCAQTIGLAPVLRHMEAGLENVYRRDDRTLFRQGNGRAACTGSRCSWGSWDPSATEGRLRSRQASWRITSWSHRRGVSPRGQAPWSAGACTANWSAGAATTAMVKSAYVPSSRVWLKNPATANTSATPTPSRWDA